MKVFSKLPNKNEILQSRSTISAVSAGVALAIAIPLTAALSASSTVAAASPASTTPAVTASSCSVPATAGSNATTSSTGTTTPVTSTVYKTVDHYVYTPGLVSAGVNVSGNTVSPVVTTTVSPTVTTNVPVLSNDNILDNNSVNVPVSVPALNNVLSPVTSIVSNVPVIGNLPL